MTPADYWASLPADQLGSSAKADTQANTRKDTRMTTNDDLDMTQFPHIFNAVLDIMPNRDMWLARFADQLGGTAVQPADTEGWLTVLHRGDVVMKLHIDAFKPGALISDAQILVDGHWQQVGLEWRDGTDEAVL